MCSIDNSDVDADISVCPISIPDTVYDFKGLPPDILVTQEAIHSFKLNETDDVLFSGLFLPYHGANRNYPIVRHGKLALIPQEKIPWSTPERQDLPLELYLAEVTSWSGNSGSPVFVRLSGAREEGGAMAGIRYLLLGVMMGYFNSDRPAALDTAAINETAHLQVNLSDNSGIAAVVPAQKILDIISQPRIKAYASLIKAVSHAKAGRVKEAEASFKDAIDVLRSSDPNHPLLNQATLQYAQFLRENGRYPEANFQTKMANSIGRVSDVPDDQLR